VAFLSGAEGRVIAVAHRQEAAFQAEAARQGLRLAEIASLDGYNYSRGRPVTLLLYRKAP